MTIQPHLIECICYSKDRRALLKNHHLEGLFGHFYSSLIDDVQLKEELKNQLNRQWIHNHILLGVLNELSPLIEKLKISATLLKGIHLIESTYEEIGCRFMSDIDLLIETPQIADWENLLIDQGFKKSNIKRFYGNNYKSDWSKTIGEVEVNLELHTRLFYVNNYEDWKKVHSQIIGFDQLSNEDLIIHLCGHLTLQHTMSKLYWLFDLYYFLEKNNRELNWQYINNKSKMLNVHQSVEITLLTLQKYFQIKTKDHYSLKTKIISKFISINFLLFPEKNLSTYFILKHFSKDKIWQAFRYDIKWFFHYKLKLTDSKN
jgi:hypothetical protein